MEQNFTVQGIISAEDIRRAQRVTITQNGTGYILTYEFLTTGERFEKWFKTLPDAQGIFFLFCYDFCSQTFENGTRLSWVDAAEPGKNPG